MSAFSIPLSGLAASSDSLNVIANNLSNLNTDGYKNQSVSFSDVFNQLQGVSGNGDPVELGSGVQIEGRTSNFSNGTVTTTGIASNAALQGNGFFVVENAGNGRINFTRDGSFTVNAQGQLCTQGGQLVMGYPAVNGVVSTSSALSPINVNQASSIPAVATSSFSMHTNLDAGATAGESFSTPITIFDSLGAPHVLTVTYTNAAAGRWDYSVSIPAADVGGTGTPVTLASGSLSFDSSGNMTTPNAPITGIAINGLSNGAAPMNLTWNIAGSGGSSSITQQEAASATSSTTQNGSGVGTLSGYSILSDGTVEGQFSNEQTLSLGRLAVAGFANPQGLMQVGNNDYQSTFPSGDPVIGQAGTAGNGTITGGAVEQSNVNLSTEFANMIVAQQTYEANAKVLTTMDQVSQATIQLIQ